MTESITTIKGQLLLKLLDIERTRCNSKVDEDERTESLAQLLEGQEHILERLHSGMGKYMQLLGIPEEASIDSLSIPDTEDVTSNMQPAARHAFLTNRMPAFLFECNPTSVISGIEYFGLLASKVYLCRAWTFSMSPLTTAGMQGSMGLKLRYP